MAQIFLNQVQQKLSYLLGEKALPTNNAELASRAAFIQSTLQRVYFRYNFRDLRNNTTLTFTNGVAILPANVFGNSTLDLRIERPGAFTDTVFIQIPPEDRDRYPEGSNRFWVGGVPGAYTITTSEGSNITSATLNYSTEAPTISETVGTFFSSDLALAQGALVLVKKSTDDAYDPITDEDLFEKYLLEVIEHENFNSPPETYKVKGYGNT